jgi:hypothetical protein
MRRVDSQCENRIENRAITKKITIFFSLPQGLMKGLGHSRNKCLLAALPQGVVLISRVPLSSGATLNIIHRTPKKETPDFPSRFAPTSLGLSTCSCLQKHEKESLDS